MYAAVKSAVKAGVVPSVGRAGFVYDFVQGGSVDAGILAARSTARIASVNAVCDAGIFFPLGAIAVYAADQAGAGGDNWTVGPATDRWRGVATRTWRDTAGSGKRIEMQATGLVPGQSYSIWIAGYIGLSGEATMRVTTGGVWQRPEAVYETNKPLVRAYGTAGSNIATLTSLSQAGIYIGNWTALADGAIKIFARDASGTRCGIAGLIASTPLDFGEVGQVVSNDSAQCWYNGSPHAKTAANNFLIGGVNRNGKSKVAHYNPTSKAIKETELSTWSEDDDHNNPSFVKTGDGKVLAAYAKHATANFIYYRKSSVADPQGISDWGGETAIATTGVSTYAQLYRTADDALWWISRDTTAGWMIRKSADHGATWSAPTLLHTGVSGTKDAYLVSALDYTRSRLHIHYTDSRASAMNTSVGHYYIDLLTMEARTMAGVLITDLDSAPVNLTTLTHLYLYSASALSGGETLDDRIPSVRSWCYDVAVDQVTGYPVCAYHAYAINNWSTRTSTDRIYAYVTRWTGAAWVKKRVANAGYGIGANEPGYSGGVAIDKANLGKFYLCTNAAQPFLLENSGSISGTGRFELWQGEFQGSGIKWTAITKASERNQQRPENEDGLTTWVDGTYTGYAAIGLRLRGII